MEPLWGFSPSSGRSIRSVHWPSLKVTSQCSFLGIYGTRPPRGLSVPLVPISFLSSLPRWSLRLRYRCGVVVVSVGTGHGTASYPYFYSMAVDTRSEIWQHQLACQCGWGKSHGGLSVNKELQKTTNDYQERKR